MFLFAPQQELFKPICTQYCGISLIHLIFNFLNRPDRPAEYNAQQFQWSKFALDQKLGERSMLALW